MRVLFLHAALNDLTAEYKVHTTLTTNVSSDRITPCFIWQSPAPLKQITADRVIEHDFGRDMSLDPRPGRIRRGGMMIQKLPQTLAFLFAQAKQIKPELIYTSQQDFDVRLATMLSRRFHIPHVIHIHYSVGPWLGGYTLNAIRKSSRLIAVSEYIRQSAMLQGASGESIRTIPNPAPVSQDPPSSEVQNIRAQFNIDDDAPLILAVGRLDPGKGHLALFEAFAKVIEHMPTARLLICGTSTSRDNYANKLKQRTHELAIDRHTIFAGYRSDVPAIMRSANLFCLPTELDPCPLVFLEAMAAGLPVVAFYSGGVPEMVLHDQTGLLSYPGDTETLAANLLRLLSEPALARQLGCAGQQRVAAEFAPAKVADRWLSVLQGMLQ